MKKNPSQVIIWFIIRLIKFSLIINDLHMYTYVCIYTYMYIVCTYVYMYIRWRKWEKSMNIINHWYSSTKCLYSVYPKSCESLSRYRHNANFSVPFYFEIHTAFVGKQIFISRFSIYILKQYNPEINKIWNI